MMAKLLWGNVYFQNKLAGILRQESGDKMAFIYDDSYLQSGYPSIAHTLPLRTAAHMSAMGLHPFFDNLVAEGWLEEAQTHLLGRRLVSRFELLLAFGADCPGAVSIEDPEPAELTQALLDMSDPKEVAVLTSRASLSGVQPKLAMIEKEGRFHPSRMNQLSTHIAKFPASGHPDIIINEFLTTQAFNALLPDDQVVDLWIDEIDGIDEPVLIIKRFDRQTQERIHFEEFNQLLGKRSNEKYQGTYKEMADFIGHNKYCLPTENYALFLRILAGILLGNTDMHLKNFALLYTSNGLRLTPSYDQVAAALYNYKTMALGIAGKANRLLGDLNHRNIIQLGEEFSLSKNAINMAINQLDKNREHAKKVIEEAQHGTEQLKNALIELLEKRWNGTFALIGQTLSKKP